MTERTVQVKVILRPDNRNGAMDKNGRIPDSLEPDVLGGGQEISEILVAHAGRRAVVFDGEQNGVGCEEGSDDIYLLPGDGFE